MHWLLHERSPKLGRESLIGYARELGLNEELFTRSIDALSHKKEIDADIDLAKKLDLYSTPAFYVNGIRLIGVWPYENFKEVIDREITRIESVKKGE